MCFFFEEAAILETHGIDVQSPGGQSNSDEIDGNDFSEPGAEPGLGTVRNVFNSAFNKYSRFHCHSVFTFNTEHKTLSGTVTKLIEFFFWLKESSGQRFWFQCHPPHPPSRCTGHA